MAAVEVADTLSQMFRGAKMVVQVVEAVMPTTILLTVAMVMFLLFLQAKVTLVGHLLLLLVHRRMGQAEAVELVQ
jgi:hypothetical protein